MSPPPVASVEIRLAEAAPTWVAAAVELLCAVEQADPALIPEEVREAAIRLREISHGGRW